MNYIIGLHSLLGSSVSTAWTAARSLYYNLEILELQGWEVPGESCKVNSPPSNAPNLQSDHLVCLQSNTAMSINID